MYGGSDHRQYHLATDASKTGMGGVLFQLIDCEPGTRVTTLNRKNMRIVMFISLRLEGAEPRYSTTKQEALAVWRCLKEVSWLVQGSAHPVLVYTDHSALIRLLKGDDAHGKIARWQQKQSEFDVEYVHIPGSQNVIADGLSRMPTRFFQTGLRKMKQKEKETNNENSNEEKGETEEDKNKEEHTGEECRKEEGKDDGNGVSRGSKAGNMAEVLAIGDGGGGERGRTGIEGRKGKEKEGWKAWEDSEWYGE